MCINGTKINSYLQGFLYLCRKTYLEALVATIVAIGLGYLIAGMPENISWMKVIPTVLIAFPVYGSRSYRIVTIGGCSPQEKIDEICFKLIYLIGICWLAWDIFKGIL